MAPQEPTRHQLSSRLSYSQHTPPFLQKLQNRIAGVPDEEEEFYEYDESGRPPIPQRPAIPTRPDDDPGSSDEESKDEKPQVVVLKEGKHLTEREAENMRRREKGLKPLDEPIQTSLKGADASTSNPESGSKSKRQAPSLSFSSSKSGVKASKGKRKAVGDPDDDNIETKSESKKAAGKKVKKSKALLSFGDDA